MPLVPQRSRNAIWYPTDAWYAICHSKLYFTTTTSKKQRPVHFHLYITPRLSISISSHVQIGSICKIRYSPPGLARPFRLSDRAARTVIVAARAESKHLTDAAGFARDLMSMLSQARSITLDSWFKEVDETCRASLPLQLILRLNAADNGQAVCRQQAAGSRQQEGCSTTSLLQHEKCMSRSEFRPARYSQLATILTRGVTSYKPMTFIMNALPATVITCRHASATSRCNT
jgi:hypothetical protein